jgi:tetratricopeptide (TPR) repeat protein
VLGGYVEPVEHYGRALALAEAAGNERFAVQLWANLGQSYAAAGEYTKGLDFLTRSIDAKRARSAVQRPVAAAGAQGSGVRLVAGAASAYALACRAVVQGDLGDFDSADRDIRDALAIVGDTGHAVEGSVRALQAMVEIHRGDWDACAQAADRSRTITERADSAYAFAMSSAFEAYANCKAKGGKDALEQLRYAVDWLEAGEVGLFLSFTYACLADALLAAGDALGAQDVAVRALSRAECRDPLGEIAAYRVLAQIHATSGRRGEVDECLAKAMRAAEKRGSKREVALIGSLEEELKRRTRPSSGPLF